MTPAEFRTLREACGLSQQDAATFHDVSLRTIAHWETGRNAIPVGAAQELLDLNATIERGVQNVLTLAGEIAAQHGEPAIIRLTRYRTADDYAGSRPDREGLAHPCHNAMLGRVLVALRRSGRAAEIVYAAPAEGA